MEKRVIDQIRKEIGCGDTLADQDVARIFSSTFTESRISLGFAVEDAKRAILKSVPEWLSRR